MASDHIRASDHDRDVVVATLRDAFSEGRLTLDEFQDRMAVAYAGRTWGDLRKLTTDLPVQPPLGADLPAPPWWPLDAHPEANAIPPRLGAYPPYDTEQIPGAQQVPGAQPGTGSQSASELPPSLNQPATGNMPPSTRPRPRLAPVLPIVSMWILFALATRTAGGAVVFLIAVVTMVTLASLGRRR
jgi:hypothetical protein